MIPSQEPGQSQGFRYTFVDEAVVAGQTYEYLLEDVDANGTRTPHGPVVAKALYTAYLPLVLRQAACAGGRDARLNQGGVRPDLTPPLFARA